MAELAHLAAGAAPQARAALQLAGAQLVGHARELAQRAGEALRPPAGDAPQHHHRQPERERHGPARLVQRALVQADQHLTASRALRRHAQLEGPRAQERAAEGVDGPPASVGRDDGDAQLARRRPEERAARRRVRPHLVDAALEVGLDALGVAPPVAAAAHGPEDRAHGGDRRRDGHDQRAEHLALQRRVAPVVPVPVRVLAALSTPAAALHAPSLTRT
jgi:hypothetical protein